MKILLCSSISRHFLDRCNIVYTAESWICMRRSRKASLNGLSATKSSGSLIQGATGEPVRVRSTQPRAILKGDSCHSFCHFTETHELSEPSVPLLRVPWTGKVDRLTETTAGGHVYYGAASFKTRALPQNKEAFEASENGAEEKKGGWQECWRWMACRHDYVKLQEKKWSKQRQWLRKQ